MQAKLTQYQRDERFLRHGKREKLENKKGVTVMREEFFRYSPKKHREYLIVWHVVRDHGEFVTARKGLKDAHERAEQLRANVKTGRLTDQERAERDQELEKIAKLCAGDPELVHFAVKFVKAPRNKREAVMKRIRAGERMNDIMQNQAL